MHVHVCIHCGSSFRREAVEGRVHTTGLFICPKCGREGPLNIEIHKVDDDESPILKTE
jgi:predicted nucleic-acid-binding Zn-ribbon protein